MTAHADAVLPPQPGAGMPGLRWPWVFLPLLVPFGLSSGYVSVTLAFLLGRAGLSTFAISTIIAASIWPQTWKVLWAPLIDTVGDAKWWYGLGAALVGLTLLVMSALPATAREVPLLTLLAVLSSVASTLVSMASEAFLTRSLAPGQRGLASGWSQAGNLGGAGVGGGVGLLLAQHVAQAWVSGAVLAAMSLACWAFVLLVPSVPRGAQRASLRAELAQVPRDVWQVARSRIGYLALIIMVMPIASNGAPWPAIAGEWHADADLVALVNGMVGGLVTALGALVVGPICDRLDPKLTYCLCGLLCGVCTVAMGFSPRTPAMFALYTLAYGAVVGGGYTAYSAVVLEAVGQSSAVTNFNLLAAVSNVPIAAMASFDGWVHDHYGTQAMLYGELALPAVTIGLFALFALATRRRGGAR